MKPKGLLIGTVIIMPAVFLGLVLSIVLLLGSTPAAAVCDPSVSVSISADTKFHEYSPEQLTNAAAIMNAGKSLNLSAKGQMISVMVALGESGLRVLDIGDGAGPDSRGLFQQRDNGAWGSYADRMNPSISAANFVRALQKIDGWESLEPTIAANRVQRNADPYHYRRYWVPATKIVEALSDTKLSLTGAGCAIPGASGAGDDLPWANAAVYQPSALGMFNRECVDFALWRVNQQLGSTAAPYKILNSTFRPDGVNLGSALSWRDGWNARGWPTGTAPRVGAIVWYAPGAGGADPTYGHVAVVKALNTDGTYLEEGYNGNPAPEDHQYYTRTVNNAVPSAFLYVPGSEEKK
ncbi:CHAP domain-containing protein [Arthrobacter sp. ov118]|uniref:CHAP domain-containing protein n=1 Tax=Arthrobacter sp. ov118 TaxID=1761747 RepID=UPI0008E388C4|nr:CHAP domain-containing protein [Arthrobacter sp. ov118]SFU10645.1 CHAP domain-containing protein [Arthrobacter sp. ov118]